ncbi:MAG: TetR family transcriptional regulator [Pseudonocardiaceae bacterium]|nr:TetR family transcriptional regulator [Pseudonocardiaceae bacterium]
MAKTAKSEKSESARRGYHHGDLRNALIEAAAQLALDGGPESVTIRAAARAVGVTPTAAYRHFAGHEELVEAAKQQAMEHLTGAMAAEIRSRPDIDDRTLRALSDFAAIGRGYLNFALDHPGLFRTAFSRGGPLLPPPEEQTAESPFRKLVDAMDELVNVGYLPAERRPLAELTAWSMVHGLAMLVLEGPLREIDEQTRHQVLLRSIEIMGSGLSGSPLPAELRAVLADLAGDLDSDGEHTP